MPPKRLTPSMATSRAERRGPSGSCLWVGAALVFLAPGCLDPLVEDPGAAGGPALAPGLPSNTGPHGATGPVNTTPVTTTTTTAPSTTTAPATATTTAPSTATTTMGEMPAPDGPGASDAGAIITGDITSGAVDSQMDSSSGSGDNTEDCTPRDDDGDAGAADGATVSRDHRCETVPEDAGPGDGGR